MAAPLLGMLMAVYAGLRMSRPALLGLPDTRDAHLDERQRERLAYAVGTAYRVICMILMAAILTFILGGESLLAALKNSQAGAATAFVFAWLIPFLPNAVLAWTEPDLEPDVVEPGRIKRTV